MNPSCVSGTTICLRKSGAEHGLLIFLARKVIYFPNGNTPVEDIFSRFSVNFKAKTSELQGNHKKIFPLLIVENGS